MNTRVMRFRLFLTSRLATVLAVGGLTSFGLVGSAWGQLSQTQPTPIVINDDAAASPSPSEIEVTGKTGTIKRVTVRLSGLTHSYPDDVDIVLVSPNGTEVLLMSDAGGSGVLNGVDLTFADSGGSAPDNSQITTGTYRPSNYNGSEGAVDVFPGGPVSPFGSSLSLFNDENPNGKWKLYVVDDTPVDVGSIGSWTLNLWLTPTLATTNAVTMDEDGTATVNITVGSSSASAESLTVSAVSSDQFVVTNRPTALVVGGSGANRTLTIIPQPNANTEGRPPQGSVAPITITVSVGDGVSTTMASFSLTVRNVNDVPSIFRVGTSSLSMVAGGQSTNVNVVLSDIDVPLLDASALTMFATSDNPAVVAPTNVFFGGTPASTNRIVTFTPNGAATGTATLSLWVVDNTDPAKPLTNATASTVTVTVTPVAQKQFANVNAVVINDNATATPYPSEVAVTGVTGTVGGVSTNALIGRVTVLLADMTHNRPEDLDLLLVGPQGQAVVLMGQAGNGNALSHARLTFNDAAAADVPDSGAIGTGAFATNSWRPRDYTVADLPGAAPAGPYSAGLSAFNETDPNGQWKLFVVDSVSGEAGRINNGWLLNIFQAPRIQVLTNRTMDEDTTLTYSFEVKDFDGTISTVTASSDNPSLVSPSITTGGGLTNLVLTPAANQNGSATISVVATDNAGFRATNRFVLTVLPINDTPTISVIAKQVTRVGIPIGPTSFTVGDLETAAGALVVSAISSNQKVLPNSSIVIGGSGATRTVTLFPAGVEAGSAEVTVTVTDGALSASRTFTFTAEVPGNPLYENAGVITINDNSTATPYPSTIGVSNLVGQVNMVQVTLAGLTHPSPTDLDILLVGPAGQKLLLMSDAGGANALENTQLVFTNGAPSLPQNTLIVSGFYGPSDYAGGDSDVVTNVVGGAMSTSLAAFDGSNPNGNWRLYVLDDSAVLRGGVIGGGWQLSIQTRPKLTLPPGNQVTDEDVDKRVTVGIGDDQPGVALTVTATSSDQNLVPNANISISGTGASRELRITPRSNQNGSATITVTVSDGVNIDTGSFTLVVNAVDDMPTIAGLSNRSTPAATPITVPFTVSDPETPGAITVTAISSDQSLVPDGNISLGGSGASRTITILPAGVRTGTANITVTATDGTGQKSSVIFQLTVTGNLAFANTTRVEIPSRGAATPYPSVINVSGIGGMVSHVRVDLLGFGHTFPDDVDVLLVSPGGQKVMLMSDAGGGLPGVSGLRLTFTDTATTLLADGTAMTNGIYRPSNFDGLDGDAFPADAPGGPYSTSLGDVVGGSPNGDWKLYVQDDEVGESGALDGGWILVLQTGPTIAPIAAQSTLEDTVKDVPFTLADEDTVATNLMVTAATSGDSVAGLVAELRLIGPSNSFNQTLRITPGADKNGTNVITLTVSDGTTSSSRSFPFQVTAVDDPPTITTATNRLTIAEDTMIDIVYQIDDVDSTIGVTNVTVTSSDPTLVPNLAANLTLTEPGRTGVGHATVNLKVTPVANLFGSTVLTFTLTDRNRTATHELTLTVNNVNDVPTITAIPNQTVVAGSSTTNINFTVGDRPNETPPENLVVTATSDNPGLVPANNIVLGGSGAARTIQLTTIGVNAAVANITVAVSDGQATNTTVFTVTSTASPVLRFANTTAITIRDNTTANLYPSVINVSGLVGNVRRVYVTLDGFTHTIPADVDILLVGPAGQKMVLMSDAGGSSAVSNLRLRFDDTARMFDGALESGTNAPTNLEGADAFAAPAPGGPYEALLAAFNGTNPNGAWSLYVVDDAAGGAGAINFGWELTFETTPTITVTTPAAGQAAVWNEDLTGTVIFTIADSMTNVDNLVLEASSSNPTLLPNANVTFARSGGTVTATLRSAADQSGTNNLTLTVRRPGDGVSASIVVPNSVNPVNDGPLIARVTDKTTEQNMPITFDVLVSDVDTGLGNLKLEVTSGNQALIANTNLLLFGRSNVITGLSSDTVPLTLRPNLNAFGSTLITLTLTDLADTNNPLVVVSNFMLTVLQVNNAPTISAIPLQTTPANTTLSGIAFTVGDLENGMLTITTASSDQSLVRNANIVVNTPVGPPGARTLAITTEPSVEGRVTITVTVTDNGSPNKSTSTSFTLNVQPSPERTFANSTPIVIRDNTSAQPYPSTITVSGLAGQVTKVTATLSNFAHRFPDDVDILLVGPAGQKVMLMSDAGGGTAVTNLNLTFDQGAPAGDISDNGPLTTSTNRPANYEAGDTFPASAPVGPYSTSPTLNDFNGQPPNGDWQLYIVDDTASDMGFVNGGWFLTITTGPVLNGLADVTTPEDVPVDVPFTVGQTPSVATDFLFGFTSTNLALVGTNGVIISGSGTNWTARVSPSLNASGQSRITITMTNSYGQVASSSFVVTVTAVNDPPTIAGVANQTIPAGGFTGLIPLNYSDVETAQGSLVVTATSSDMAVIPVGNVLLTANTVRVVSAGTQSGSSTITLTVTDGGGQTAMTSFVVTVTPALNPLVANTGPITISDNANAGPYPSTVDVSGVNGTVAKVTVTLAGLTHSYPDDVDVLLVGPQGQKVVLLSDAGGAFGLANARLTFDDAAASAVPDNTAITNLYGTYRPADYEASASEFPAPAPAGPYATALSAFNGIDPNGTWSLYVRDDASPDAGSIAQGWVLSIQTNVSAGLRLAVTTSTDGAKINSLDGGVPSGALLKIKIIGVPGSTANIEGTSDFAEWRKIGIVTLDASGTAEVSVEMDGNVKFFRARER